MTALSRRRPRAIGALAVTGGVLAVMAPALSCADGPVAIVAAVGMAGIGLAFSFTRPAPGGARLRDLNMSIPCPGMDRAEGPACVNYFRPPAGEFLVPVTLPSGRTSMVCRPCAASVGQGAVRVMAEVVSTGPQRELAGVVDGEIEVE